MGEPLRKTVRNKSTGEIRDAVSNDDGKTWQFDQTSQGDMALDTRINDAGPEDTTAISPPHPEDSAPAPSLEGFGAGTRSPKTKPAPDALTSAARGYGQGATLGFGDEMGGLGGWLNEMANPTPRTAGRGIDAAPMGASAARGSAYEAQRDQERQANTEAEAANPTAYKGAELLGGASTAAVPIPGTGIAANAGRATRLAGYARQGAVIGGIAGLGHGEGSAADQAKSTVGGAALGAVTAPILGGTFEELGKGARGAGSAFKDFLDEHTGGPQKRELTFGSPDLARKAETMAEPVAGAERRALARAGASDRGLEAAAHDVANKASELWEHGDVVKWNEDIASKKPLVRQSLEGEGVDPVKVVQSADSAIRDVRGKLDDMATYVAKGTPDRTLINKLQKQVNEYHLARQPGSDPYEAASDRFMQMDQVKREFQNAVDNAKGQRGSAVVKELRGIEDGLRTHLESPENWGQGASALQQIRNRGWRDRMLLEGRDASPDRMFLTDATGEAGADPYSLKRAGDPAKIAQILKSQGTLAGERGGQALSQWANREADLLEALTTHANAEPALVQRAARARQLATEIDAQLGQAVKQNTAASDMAKIQAVPPPKPGPTRALAEKLPIIGGPIAALKPQSMPERIGALSNAEGVLEANPTNVMARRAVGADRAPMANAAGRMSAPQSPFPAIGGYSRDVKPPPNQQHEDKGAPAQRVADTATADPKYGAMLSAKPPGHERDVAYSVLLDTDPEFRGRERARAQREQQQER